MLSPSRITLENNEKIRLQPGRENAFARASGGAGGIRTHGTISGPPDFKSDALDHSTTAPFRQVLATIRFAKQDNQSPLYLPNQHPLGSAALSLGAPYSLDSIWCFLKSDLLLLIVLRCFYWQ